MIDLAFDPDLRVGPLLVAWHALFAVLGIATGAFLAVRLGRSRVPEDRMWAVVAWAVATGFVGARALHVIERWDSFARDPARVLAIGDGGLSNLGAIVAGAVAVYLAGFRYRAPVGFLADVAGCVAGLGLGIGRVGDVINGEHHAVACAGLPWCVRYTHPNTLGQRDPVHPAVAYELVIDLVIAALLWWLRPRAIGRAPEGRLLMGFFALYGAARFLLGFLRLDPLVLDGLRQQQVVALGLLAVGTSVLVGSLAGLARPRREPA